MNRATKITELPALTLDFLNTKGVLIDNVFASLWRKTDMKTLLSRAGFNKRSGTPMYEVIYALMLWIWLKKTPIMSAIGHQSKVCYTQKVGTLPAEGDNERQKQTNEIGMVIPLCYSDEQIDRIAGEFLSGQSIFIRINTIISTVLSADITLTDASEPIQQVLADCGIVQGKTPVQPAYRLAEFERDFAKLSPEQQGQALDQIKKIMAGIR